MCTNVTHYIKDITRNQGFKLSTQKTIVVPHNKNIQTKNYLPNKIQKQFNLQQHPNNNIKYYPHMKPKANVSL